MRWQEESKWVEMGQLSPIFEDWQKDTPRTPVFPFTIRPMRAIAMAEAFALAVNVTTAIDLLTKVGVLCSAYCAGLKFAPRHIRYTLKRDRPIRSYPPGS